MIFRSAKKPAKIETKPLNLTPRMLALEPRYVFDAALAGEIAEAHEVSTADIASDTSAADAATSFMAAASDFGDGQSAASADAQVSALLDALVEGHNAGSGNNEIAFIDSRLDDLAGIIAAIPQDTRIVVIDGGRDGVMQMAHALQNESGITGIHIISHGQAGSLQLGSSTLDVESMSTAYSEVLQSISANLAEGADILVYGCNFGAGDAGAEAAALLSELTGADVASSDDLTGAEELGGDWDLEKQTGVVESRVLSAPEWDSTLAPLNITVTGQPTVTGATGTNASTALPEGVAGLTAVWTNAGTIGTTPIDVKATLMSLSNGTASFNTSGDDLSFWINNPSSTAVVKWEIFASGTNQTVYAVGSPNLQITDIDGSGSVPNSREIIRPQLGGLTSFTLENPTNLVASTSAAGVNVSGTQNQTQNPPIPISMVGFTWQEVSSWTVEYQLTSAALNANFRHDGDGDFIFAAPNTTFLLSLDLDANNSTATGNNYATSYTENGAGVPVVDADRVINQHSVLGTTLGEAKVVLTNAQAGDRLLVAGSALPSGTISGVNYTIVNSGGQITIEFSGSADASTYQSILSQVTFDNTTDAPSTLNRTIDVNVTNTTFGTTSNTATSTISVSATNDPPVATPSTSSGNEDTDIPVSLAGTDPDGTVQSITVTSLPPAGEGVLYYADGTTPVSTSTPLTPAQAASLVFTPAANFNGTVTIPFTVTDNNGSTSAPANEVITIANVLDAPSGTDSSITLNEDGTHTITASDFGFSDPDGDSFQGVKITTLPTAGTLLLSGNPVSAGDVVSASDVASGLLTFEPAANAFGTPYANFQFQVVDDSAVSLFTETFGAGTGRASFGSAGLTGTTTYNYDGTGTIDDGDYALVSQIDPSLGNWWNTTNFSTYDYSQTDHTGDPDGRFMVVNASFSAGEFYRQGVTITQAGDYQVSVALANGNSFTVKPNVTISILDSGSAVVATINTGDLPDYTSANNWQTYALTAALAPGNYTFVLVNNAPGGFGNDLYVDDIVFSTAPPNCDTTPNTMTFNVADVNDPPVATPSTSSGNEDTPITVNLTGTDVDGTVDFVTVTALPPAGEGVLYMPDGTTPVTANTPISAADAANLVFVPATNFNGTVTIPFTVTDNDGGVSTPANEVITVADVNDPPVATPSTSSGNEDTPITVNLTGTDVDGTVDFVTVTALPPAGEGVLYMPDGTTPVTANTPISAADAANLVFVPATNFNGTVTIPFTVTDNDGGVSTPANEVITVADVNDPPVATPSTSSGDEDTPITVNLTGTDVDGTVDFVTVTALPPAGEGVLYYADGTTPVVAGTPLTPAEAASLVFVPATNFNGTVTIPFTVTDNDGGVSTPANEVITVADVNDPPVATPSTSSGDEDTPITVNLTGTDVDGTIDFVTVTALPPVGEGVLYYADGTTPVTANTPISAADAANLVFVPATNFNGTVTIPFTVTDNDGGVSTPANEVITVADVNDPPVATPSTSSGDEDTPITVNLTGTDVDGTVDFVTVTALPPAGEGVLYMPDGTTPVTANTPISAADAANLVFVPATNFNGTVTIPFTVTDNDGGVSTPANEVITVADVNDPPVATPSTSSGNEDTPITVNLTGTDVDGTVDFVTVTALPPAGEGVLYMPDGTTPVTANTPISAADAANLVFVPATNFNGTVTIPFTVTDNDGGVSTPANEVITVADVNDPPVATPSTSSGNEDTPITVNLTGTDVDGTVDFVTVTALPPAGEGVLYYADGTTPVVAGTPLTPAEAASLVFVPATNFNGTVTIPFTVTDNDGGVSTPANEVITVADVNDPPVATPSTSTGNEDTPIAVSLTGTDADGTIASVTVTSLPPVSQGVLYMPNGTTPVVAGTPLTPAQAASLVFKPAANFNGTVTIPFTVTDNDGGVSTPANEVITVNAINDAPVDGNEVRSLAEDTPLGVSAANGLLANASDIDGDTLKITAFSIQGLTGPFVVGTAKVIPDVGTFKVFANGAYSFVPARNYHGPVPTITYTVSDGNGGTDTSTLKLTVTPVNDGPDARHQTSTTGFQTPVSVPLLANDFDIDGDTLSVVSASVPASQGTLRNVGGVWTFTPAPAFSGTATITYTIRDSAGATDTGTHTVIVANAPPILTGPGTGGPGTPFVDPADPRNLIVPAVDSTSLTVDLDTYLKDPNGNAMTISPNLTGLPSWLSYDPVAHVFSGTPPADNTGPVTIPVTVRDAFGGVLSAKVTIVITNPPPDAVDGSSATTYAEPVTVPLLANDRDADGDTLTVVAASVPATQGTLAKVGANWVFTPRTGFAGTAVITYTIRDQDGATDTARHTVTVARPPLVAASDVFTTKFNTTLNADASAGDTFVTGSVFTVESNPSEGTVTMQSNGKYVYVPKPGFAGKVTFTYRVTDPTGAFRIATETINVASQPHDCIVTFGKR